MRANTPEKRQKNREYMRRWRSESAQLTRYGRQLRRGKPQIDAGALLQATVFGLAYSMNELASLRDLLKQFG
jgi:hypothetical protein